MRLDQRATGSDNFGFHGKRLRDSYWEYSPDLYGNVEHPVYSEPEYETSREGNGHVAEQYQPWPSGRHENTTLSQDKSKISLDARAIESLVSLQQDISACREKTLIERVRLREQRRALRDTREKARKAALDFVEVVRGLLQGQDGLDRRILDELYERSKASYDVYGAVGADYYEAEDSYADLEEQYNMEEWEFSRQESELYEQVQRVVSGRPETPITRSSSVYSKETTPIRSQFRENKEDPLVSRYKSLLGKVEMLQEARDDLAAEHLEVLDEKHLYESRGEQLNWSNQQFLDDYDNLYDEASQKLQDAQLEVESLRSKLFHTHDGKIPRSRRASDAQSLKEHVKTNAKQSNLLQSLGPPFDSSRSDSGLITLKRHFALLRQRISDWIFDNLKSTKLEQLNHKAILNYDTSLNNGTISDDEWWVLVQKHWNKGAYWDNDGLAHYMNLRNSLTEYDPEDSNARNISTTGVPLLDADLHSNSREEVGMPTALVAWPSLQSPDQLLKNEQYPMQLQVTPPEPVRDLKLPRRLKSTSSIRPISPLAPSIENDLSRRSLPP